jgi:flagellar hook-length control protein FliK
MEFLTALPADLVAAADPSARAAAPLLRPADADGKAPTAAMPFELCLALLTTPLPDGESWPAAGKELPVVPLEPVLADAAAGTAPELLPGLLPAAVADAALQARLRFMEPPPTGVATEAAALTLSSIETKPAEVASTTLPGGETTVATDALASLTSGELEPTAALATAEALQGTEPEIASAPAKSALAPSWLEAFTHERRLQRPSSATLADVRAAASSAGTTAAPAGQTPPNFFAAMPVADASQPVRNGLQHIELPKLLAPVPTVGGEGTTIAQPDWLPPATHSGAMSAAASTTALPGTPVDLRSPNGPETFAHRVQWLVDQHVGEAHIKLNPPELGAVDVKISLVDDKTYVQLTTATAAARDELSQSLPRLRELFTVSGLELGGASVHNGRDGHPARHGYGAEAPGSLPFAPFSDDGEDVPAFLPRRTLGRIDLFA